MVGKTRSQSHEPGQRRLADAPGELPSERDKRFEAHIDERLAAPRRKRRRYLTMQRDDAPGEIF